MPGNPLKSISSNWVNVLTPGETSAELSLILDVTFETFAPNKKAGLGTGVLDVQTAFNGMANGIELAFYGNFGENQTGTISVYAWRTNLAGPAIPVFIGASEGLILGTAVCLMYPHANAHLTLSNYFWADTLSGSDCWPTGVVVNDSGNNRICRLSFDLCGYRYIQVGYTAGTMTNLGVAAAGRS